ncbi:MAG: hypothetical protein JW990_04640 [Thermoleophilia bacterium]|nr:hypothetical protein [Thermoleophilia bacterium]
MTVVRRIVLGYAGLVVFGLALLGVGLGAVLYFQSGFEEYTGNTTAQLTAAHQIIEGESRMGAYGLSAIGIPAMSADLKAKVDEIYNSTKQVLDTAESLDGGDQEQRTVIAAVRTSLDQYYKAIDDSIALAATDGEAAWAKVAAEVIPTAQGIHAAATAYLDKEEALEAAEHERMDGLSTTMLVVLLVVGCVGVALAVVLSVFISRSIARQLRDATTSLSSTASELLAVAAQVAAGAAQTATSTTETTATVEEVKQTAQLAHEKATQVADSSQGLAELADAGRGAVDGTVGGIERMQAEMTVVAETIRRLSEQTEAVGDIISTVNDIAEQSNLLSVNASIEAAKAGEHGKGFTVVAQEVKSLAEQSKQAVTQVRMILGEIQKAGSRAVEAAGQSQQAIEAARQQSVETGEAAQGVAATANEAAEAAVQISASSRQQLAGMEQISQAIDSITQAMTQSVAGTRQVEQEVRQLQELSVRLKRLVDAKAVA